MRSKFDDYAALEADVLLTSILYTRVKPSNIELALLSDRIKYLRNLITKK